MAFHDDFGNDVVDLTTRCGCGIGHPATFTETGGYLQLQTGGFGSGVQWQNWFWSNPTEYTTYMQAYTGIPTGYNNITGWSAIICLSYYDAQASYGGYPYGFQGLMIGCETNPWDAWLLQWGLDANIPWEHLSVRRCVLSPNHDFAEVATASPDSPDVTPIYMKIDYVNVANTVQFYYGTNGVDWTNFYGPVSSHFVPTRIGPFATNTGCIYCYNSVITGRYTDLWVNPIGPEPGTYVGNSQCSVPPMDGNFTLNHYWCLKSQFTNSSRENNPTVAPFALANQVGNLRGQIGGRHVSGSLD